MPKLSNLDRFYLRHQIRETLVLVGYDESKEEFKEIRDLLYEIYNESLINDLVKEIKAFKDGIVPIYKDGESQKKLAPKIPASLRKFRTRRKNF